jgi:hypothetical protein
LTCIWSGRSKSVDRNANTSRKVDAELRVPCEVYSRVVGYLRPVQSWHDGKRQEFEERQTFVIEGVDMESTDGKASGGRSRRDRGSEPRTSTEAARESAALSSSKPGRATAARSGGEGNAVSIMGARE